MEKEKPSQRNRSRAVSCNKDKKRGTSREKSLSREMAKRRRRSKRKRTRKGGFSPIGVDFKQGFKVTKDLVKALKKPINVKKAKAAVQGYKQQYQQYKRRGGTKSYNSWLIDKGYAERNSGCCVM